MTQLVSILIPAFNAEQWIAETVNSAINQTWPKKEIIIVDDGSTDATYEIARSLESKIVKVVTQENRGACAARNKALSLSQGSYIQWLDADDLLHPKKIEYQLKKCESGNNSKTLLTCSWGKFFFRPDRAKFRPDSLWKDLGPVEWIITKFTDNVWMNPAVWLVSRRITEDAGLWDERLSSSGIDDGEYICRLASACDYVRFIQEAKCYYRIGNFDSLNCNIWMSKNNQESLILSLTLAIQCLLSLENSERTRTASMKHLQTWLPIFYPENKIAIEKMYILARELGRELYSPSIPSKYFIIYKLFGYKKSKKAISQWNTAKLKALRFFDRLRSNY